MNDDDAEEEEMYREELAKRYEEVIRAQQYELALKTELAKALDGPAYERMVNIKLVNPQRYYQLAPQLIQVYRQLGRKITEEELIKILERITRRRETKIERK